VTPYAVSTTFIRLGLLVLVPLAGLLGAFMGIVKLFPERTAIVVGYQKDVIDGLIADNARLAESVAHLEGRVRELEDEPRGHLA
jgi:hypothetical protein